MGLDKMRTVEQRFTAKVNVDDNGCWMWTGATRRKGYGAFWTPAGITSSHRWSYEHWVAPIPDGLQIDHLCRVPACVNPAHLEPVTPGENTRRGEPHQRTHCPHGHAFTAANTYIQYDAKPGWRGRQCWTCRRNRDALRPARAR